MICKLRLTNTNRIEYLSKNQRGLIKLSAISHVYKKLSLMWPNEEKVYCLVFELNKGKEMHIFLESESEADKWIEVIAETQSESCE